MSQREKASPNLPPEYRETEAQQEERLLRWWLGVSGVGIPDPSLSLPHTSVAGPKVVAQVPPSPLSAAGHLPKPSASLPTPHLGGRKGKPNVMIPPF